jgi:hypothetical protein
VTFPHCHPVPTSSFSESVAMAAIKQFQTEVDGSSWEGPEVVTVSMVCGVGGDSTDGEEVEDNGVGAFESDEASCNAKEKSLPTDARVRMIATEPVGQDQLLTKEDGKEESDESEDSYNRESGFRVSSQLEGDLLDYGGPKPTQKLAKHRKGDRMVATEAPTKRTRPNQYPK